MLSNNTCVCQVVPSLPFGNKGHDLAILEHPSRDDELIIAVTESKQYLSAFYTLNTSTNRFTKFIIDYSIPLLNGTNCSKWDFIIKPMAKLNPKLIMLRGTKPNCAIIFGVSNAAHLPGSCYSFYGVLDTISMQFERIYVNSNFDAHYSSFDNSQLNSLDIAKKCHLFDMRYRLHGWGMQASIYKEWLFLSGGTDCYTTLSIFLLDKKTQYPQLVQLIRLKKAYTRHNMIVLSDDDDDHDHDEKQDIDVTKKDKDKDHSTRVNVILFGGFHKRFIDSFCKVNIKIDSKVSIKVKNKEKIDKDLITVNIINNPKEWIGNIDDKDLKLKFESKWYYGGYEFICNNEYLLLFGGSIIDSQYRFIYYDMKKCQWKLSTLSMLVQTKHKTLKAALFSRFGGDSVVVKKKCQGKRRDRECIYAFGTNYHSFKILTNIDIEWKQERIIWIGFYKNETNDTCLIKQLPKDVLVKILKWLSNDKSIIVS